jgi:hypothetical protein
MEVTGPVTLLFVKVEAFVHVELDTVMIPRPFVSSTTECEERRLPCVNDTTKKYCPDGCHRAEQSYKNSAELQECGKMKIVQGKVSLTLLAQRE